MEAHELYALSCPRFDRVLQARCVREKGNAVGLQRDGLIKARKPRGRAAFPIDDRNAPPEFLAGFFDVDPIEVRDVVLLVAGEKNEVLAGLRFWGLRVARPKWSAGPAYLATADLASETASARAGATANIPEQARQRP